MNNWNQVEATAFIGGKECKFTNLTLNQVFDGHHSFDIGILCPLLPGKGIWYNEREDMIARQGERVEIRMKHVISGDENRFKGIIAEISMEGERGVSGTIKGDLVLKSASKALLQGAEDARISKG